MLVIILQMLVLLSYSNGQVFMNSSLENIIHGPRDNETQISMLITMNYGGFLAFGPLCSKPIEIALETLSRNPKWLPGYNLNLELIDEECEDSIAIEEVSRKIFIDNQNISRIPFTLLGYCPTIGLAMTTKVLKHADFIGVTMVQTDTDFIENPKLYDAVYQTNDEAYFKNYFAIAELLEKMNWKKIAIYSEDNPFFNEMESHIQRIINDFDKNITISYIGPKLRFLDNSNAEVVGKAIQTIKSMEIRIMISHSDYPIDISCWLHRYGMFGPNYVIFASSWQMFDANTRPIPDYLPWCTREMVKEVVESYIYVGFGNNRHIYGDDFTDSAGLTYRSFIDKLDKKIIDSKSNPKRDLWWPECYDPGLVALFTVNEAEQILQERYNSTLSQWTTDTNNFIGNGDFISNVFREAIYNIDVFGAMGRYNFDKMTKRNSNGFKPTMFFQRRYQDKEKTKLELLPVTYFEKIFVDMNGGFKFGGKTDVPVDAPKEIYLEKEIIPQAVYIFLCVLAIFGILLALFFFLALFCDQIRSKHSQSILLRLDCFKLEDATILVGIIILFSSVFATPNGKRGGKVSQFYESHIFLLVSGFSIIMAGIFGKIRKSKKIATSNQNTSVRYHKLAIIWPIFQIALIASLVGIGTFSQLETINVGSHYSADATIVYKDFLLEIPSNQLLENNRSLGLVAVILCSNALAILYCLIACHSSLRIMKAKLKSGNDPELLITFQDFKMASQAVYCFSILICGIVLISLTTMRQKNGSLVIISSVAAATCALAFLMIIFCPKLFAKETVETKENFAWRTSRKSNKK